MHRFFVTADSIAGPTVELTPQQAHQVRNVLRLAPPDRIIVLDNTGFEYEAELTTLHQEKLHARILHKRLVNTEPDTQLSLMPSLLPREKFEHILQKCTEVGVARFLPIVTRRSLIKDPKIKTAKLTRWRKIITEAAEQSHRGRIPHLAAPVTFADATSEISSRPLTPPKSRCSSARKVISLTTKSPPPDKKGPSPSASARASSEQKPPRLSPPH